MRSTYRFFILYLSVVAILGCSDSIIPEGFRPSLAGHSLNISKNNLEFNAQGGVENVTVHTNNVAWRFTGLPAWLSVSPQSGNSTASVAFTAKENLSTDTARTAIFYLESTAEDWNYKAPVSATQAAMTAQLTVATNSVQFSGGSGIQTIRVVSNTDWDATSSASWVKAEPSQDKSSVVISVEDNPTDASRSATVTLSAGGRASANISVVQEAAGVTGSTETLQFEKDGGTQSTTITAEAAWEAKTSNSWISVSPTSGNAGSHTLYITAMENSSVSERTGFVYVAIGSSTKLQIPITQKGLYIEANPNSLSFSADTEQKQLSINSNFDWTILSSPDWLTITPTESSTNQTIIVSSQKNESTSSRRGNIKIGREGLSLSASVDVVQEGMTLTVDNNIMDLTDKASTQSITITTIATWNASCSESWIHLSKVSGVGNAVLSVSVDENTSESSRNGVISINAGDLNQTITVKQAGKYFTIDAGDKQFESKGGTLQISFSTNESWTASLEQNASWLSLSSISGNGDGLITLTASKNSSMKARENAVVIRPAVSQKIKIIIKQKGLYMNVDHSTVRFGKEGGTSDNITISTDGEFEITTSNSWLAIDNKNQNVFTISANENKGSIRNGIVKVSMKELSNGENYSVKIDVYQDGIDTNGHECVDLGLPSGTLWAKCNIGASSNTQIGNFYAWGETITKNNYSSSTYKYYNDWKLTKYCTNSAYGSVDNKTTLDVSDDVARQTWGGSWRMPTEADYEELMNYCKLQNTTLSGVYGLMVTGPNGNSIFFCGTGYYEGTEYHKYSGYYWASSLRTSQNHYAYYFLVQPYNQQQSFMADQMRYCGLCVRAVCK